MRYNKTSMLNFPRLSAVFAALTLTFSFLLAFARAEHSDISGGVLRLHVIANSDTATDQALKLKVRNRILKEAGAIFGEISDCSSAIAAAKENLPALEQAAQDEIRRNGYCYPVKIEIGKSRFPTKNYGAVALPAGEYDAVRIVIGSGKGQNWWCVMFPPLCFTNGTAAIPPEAEQKLKNSLSEEEYNLITSQQDGDLPVQIKFKFLELAGNLFK